MSNDNEGFVKNGVKIAASFHFQTFIICIEFLRGVGAHIEENVFSSFLIGKFSLQNNSLAIQKGVITL